MSGYVISKHHFRMIRHFFEYQQSRQEGRAHFAQDYQCQGQLPSKQEASSAVENFAILNSC